jgi:hypothetical protein
MIIETLRIPQGSVSCAADPGIQPALQYSPSRIGRHSRPKCTLLILGSESWPGFCPDLLVVFFLSQKESAQKWPMTFSTSPRPMKMWEGEPPGESLIVPNSARGDARPPPNRIFLGVRHDLLEFTKAGENGSGSHGERIGDSGRREPWVFLSLKSPRFPQVPVGTHARSAWLPKRAFS